MKKPKKKPNEKHSDNTRTPDPLPRDPKGKFAKGAGKPWKPGQSGNPAGRPKEFKSLTSELKDSLDKSVSGYSQLAKVAQSLGMNTSQSTVRELLIMATLVHAMKGNQQILIHILDRIDGKVADRIAGHDGGPIGAISQGAINRVMGDPEAMAHARELAKRIADDKGEPDGSGNAEG